MSLHAHFEIQRPAHQLHLDLDAEPGEVVGLIGPNGAGKTTTLRALAGLLPITSGSIVLDGETLAAEGRHVPAHRRDVGVVFQDHLLFPHLSALDNVAFGPRSHGVGKASSRRTANLWLERLGIADLAARKPREMSGGQAQRVAIARALATAPRMLLLDEPTASLDAAAAMRLRARLRRHLVEFSGVSIVVTHTALDAMVMADRLAVLDEGRIVQMGRPSDVAARPRTHHVAALVGLNLVSGQAQHGVVRLSDDAALVAADPVTGPAFAAFAPSAVSLYVDRPSGSPRNLWGGTVTSVAPHGDAVRVQVEAAVPLLADVTPGAVASLRLVPGTRVWAAVKATEIQMYAADSGASLRSTQDTDQEA